MKCLHCEKPLGLFARVSRRKFCCSDHEREYQRAQDKLAIEYLDRVNNPSSSAKKDARKFPGFGAKAAAPPAPVPEPTADTPTPAVPVTPAAPRVIAPRVKGDVEMEATTLGPPVAPVAADGPRDPFVYRGAARFNPTDLLGALPPTELRSRDTAVPRKIGGPAPPSDDPFKLLDDQDIVIPASVRRAPIVLGPVDAPLDAVAETAGPVSDIAPAAISADTELNPNGEFAPWTNVGFWIDGIVTVPPAFAFQVEMRPRNFNTVALIAHPGGLLTEYVPFEVPAAELPVSAEPAEAALPAPPPPKPDPTPAIHLPLTAAAHAGQVPDLRGESGDARASFSWRTLDVAVALSQPAILTAAALPSAAPAAAAVDPAFQTADVPARWTPGQPASRAEALAAAGAPMLSFAPAAATKRVARATRPEILSGNSYPRLRMRWLRPTGRRIPIASPAFALALAPFSRLAATVASSPAALTQTKTAARVSVDSIVPAAAGSVLSPSLHSAAGVAAPINAVETESRLRRSWPWLRAVKPVPPPAASIAPAPPALRCDPTVSVPVRLAYHVVEAAPRLAPVTMTFASPASTQQPIADQQANQQKGQPAKARRR